MNTVELTLPSGHVALIDALDLPRVSEHRWWARKKPPWNIYVSTRIGPRHDCHQVLLHRFILQVPASQRVDHRNHNGLDNRRLNLRLATPTQNDANARRARNNTSGYRGVSWRKKSNKWTAQIQTDGRLRHLGYFTDPWEAAQAYNAEALEAWGEFALLNKHEGYPQ
jgi:hypothetical protein